MTRIIAILLLTAAVARAETPATSATTQAAATTQTSAATAGELADELTLKERPERLDDSAMTGRVVDVDPVEPQPVPPVAKHPKNGEFVVAPVPKYDPSQEFSLFVLGQYLFHPDPNDKVSPPSILAAGGLYTQQDSYAGLLGFLGYLDEDRWRVAAAIGTGQYNYNFYGIGNDAADVGRAIGIEQSFVFGMAQVIREVAPHFYIGPRAQFGISEIEVDERTVPFPLPETEDDLYNIALGIKLQYDTRDNTLYPTKGLFVEGQIDFFSESFGGDFNYQAYQIEYNQYFPVHEKGVLAVRGFGRFTSDGAPFFDLSTYGTRSDLRGYEAGKYRDRHMFAVQAEYRYLLNKWIGLAAFAGTGEVFESVGDISMNDMLPSIGVGLRIRLAKDNPVYYRIDTAYGEDGIAVYLGVGQAF